LSRILHIVNLGTEPYAPVQELQNALVTWRCEERIGDLFLLLEHTPVITLGRRADAAHILAAPELLRREGIEIHQTERGGDVTYHGPGQIVGYPILRLADYGLGASDYMHLLEGAIMCALAGYGLATHRREGIIGVWVGANKIAALGVRIKRGITLHGFALNVNPDMRHWQMIVPCGITDGWVTSMALEMSTEHALPPVAEVRERLAECLGQLLSAETRPATLADLERTAGPSSQTVVLPREVAR
jgi:lipoyl(octanoyl) transferase